MTGSKQSDGDQADLPAVLALVAEGRYDAAISLATRLTESGDGDAALCHALGLAHNGAGDGDLALNFLRRACDLAPRDPIFRKNLAAVLEAMQQYTDAARVYIEALRHWPTDPELYTRTAAALRHAGMTDRAHEMLQKALQLSPTHGPAHHALAGMLADASRLDEALHHREQAAMADPDNRAYRIALGDMLQRVGAVDAARDAYDVAQRTRASDGLALRRALTLPVVAKNCEDEVHRRREAERDVTALRQQGLSIGDPAREVAKSYFQFGAQGIDDRAFLENLAALHLEACPSLAFEAAHCGGRLPAGKPRIGFVSPFFRDHTLGRLIGGVIEHLSRDQFTVVLAGFGPPADVIAQHIADSANEFHVLPRDLKTAREALAEARLDLIVYAGIGMDPLLYFLAFARLARVQCTGWGFPVTTGIPTMDAFLSSDLIETADADAHYSETLVRLPSLGTRYAMPRIPALDRAEAAAALGLDPARHVYLYPYGPFRFPPEFDAIVARILERDPKADLVMVEGPSRHHRDLLEARLARTAPVTRGRLRFLARRPHADFLALYPAAHVVLDPLVFSGGNTSFEAFAAPVPVVTLPGPFRRARLTFGMYQRMELPDTVAADIDSYIDTAVAIACDGDRRETMIRKITERRDILYDDDAAVRDHAAAFTALLGRDQGS